MTPEYHPPQAPWLSVIHRDSHILVLEKPSGLLAVPGKPDDHNDCLEWRARRLYQGAMTVHRLDRDTSGIVVMGMTRKAHADLSKQFERRETRKSYIARVWGQLKEESGHINAPIKTDWPNRPKQIIDFENGRAAETIWKVIEREASTTRLRLTPLTGRSHQLRVHMLSIGHSILGDTFYAHPDALSAAPRLQLHAEMLGFRHPGTGRTVEFRAACPF